MARTLAYKIKGSENLPDGSITLHIIAGYVEDSVFTGLSEITHTVPLAAASAILDVIGSTTMTRRVDMRTQFSDYLLAQGVTDGPLI